MANRYFIVTFHFIFAYLHTPLNSEGNTHYSYNTDAETGPHNWIHLSELCAGENQSPINIDTDHLVFNRSLRYVNIDRKTVAPPQYVLENIGSTVSVDAKGIEQKIKGGGLPGEFTLAKLHFHWAEAAWYGSEHTVDGYSYPLEIHFVHWNSEKYDNLTQAIKFKDGLAVLGVFVQIKDRRKEKISTAMATIADHLSDIHSPGDKIDLPELPYSTFFPKKKDFYRYEGSLTTPPCSESVTWTVFKKPIYITEEQMNELRGVHLAFKNFTTNSRPTQPLNNRVVYTCCDRF